MVIKSINRIIGKFGYKIKKDGPEIPVDILQDELFLSLYDKCKDYTMTTIERMYSLYLALNHVHDNKMEGDLVECGVWRGGSSMLMASFLKAKGILDRKIYLYDTFEGMSEPSDMDRSLKKEQASALLVNEDKEDAQSLWCYSPLEEVRKNLYSTGYPQENLVFVKGKVEDVLSRNMPGKLALLRLDTDWYESTKVELELLYPLLEEKGILIIDDFGFWEGAKKAVVEYFGKMDSSPFLHRIDFTGRLLIKQR